MESLVALTIIAIAILIAMKWGFNHQRDLILAEEQTNQEALKNGYIQVIESDLCGGSKTLWKKI